MNLQTLSNQHGVIVGGSSGMSPKNEWGWLADIHRWIIYRSPCKKSLGDFNF